MIQQICNKKKEEEEVKFEILVFRILCSCDDHRGALFRKSAEMGTNRNDKGIDRETSRKKMNTNFPFSRTNSTLDDVAEDEAGVATVLEYGVKTALEDGLISSENTPALLRTCKRLRLFSSFRRESSREYSFFRRCHSSDSS